MCKKRNLIIFIAILILFSCLVLRLFYIQIYSGEKLSKSASVQRMADMEIEKPRGDILDKNLIRFTNRDEKVSIIFKPLLLRGKTNEIKKICGILNLNFIKTEREINFKKEPVLYEADDGKGNMIKGLNIQGVSVISSFKRYAGGSVAKHILGYLNKTDQVGETGIEKAFEDVLKLDMGSIAGVVTDAKSNLVQGLGYRLKSSGNKEERLNVKLTIDYHVQKIVEIVMDKNNTTGAVVVEDVCNGDIAAMASKPDFDQNDVGRYLDSNKNELFNRAVASYNVGSIFKIIDIAEAFESNVKFDGNFLCNGYISIGDKEFKCSSYERGGHGIIGLAEAFAMSCNPYFIKMGIGIGNENILQMSKKFGIGEYTGIKSQGIDESAGNLPYNGNFFSDGDTANIAIGQGDIMATPLQAADITATVANGGIKNKINIVDSIVDDDGNEIKSIRRDAGIRIMSKETSDKIKDLMEEVTTSGTGIRANLDEYGGAGGKTGSAETGQYINGEKVIHAWFVGYFPKRNPRYSISVFIENGKNGGQVAAPIFEEIAREIMKKGY